MPSLDKLGVDIILQVLRIVQQTSPSSLDGISGSCRQLYLTVQSVKYATLEVGFSKRSIKSSERIVRHVFNKAAMCDSVRSISIHCFPHDLPDIREAAQVTLDLLVKLFPRLRGLKQVSCKVETAFALKGLKEEESSWDHELGLLPTLLNVLHRSHSQCRLSVSLPSRVDLVSCLSQLENSACLFSLEVAIEGGQHLAIKELFRILPSCPKLTALRIMRDDYFDPHHQCVYLQHEDHRATLLKLNDLDLEGPNLCSAKQQGQCMGQRVSSFEDFDLSAFKRLSITSPRDLINIVPFSVNLRSLSFNSSQLPIPSDVEAILPSIFKDQSLTELSLTGCTEILSIDSMLPLKDTLKRLKIHENEPRDGTCQRRVFSGQEIEKLGKTLPNLEYLSLDVNYNGELPLKILSTISHSFPSLIQQELNLEINISNPLESLHPAATLATSLDIWTFIWKETSTARLTHSKLVSQPRLRALTINAGSFRHIRGRVLINVPPELEYERREQQTFHVRRHENAEKAAQGLAHVTCEQVEELERKIGTGTVEMRIQLRMLEQARERAKKGVSGVKDTRIDPSIPPGLPDNDYEIMTWMDTIMASFRSEHEWLEKLSK